MISQVPDIAALSVLLECCWCMEEFTVLVCFCGTVTVLIGCYCIIWLAHLNLHNVLH